MLLITRYSLPDTCYLTLVTGPCYQVFSPAICYFNLVKPDTSYLILAFRYMFSDNLYLIHLTVYLLPNTYSLIHVTRNLLPNACYPNLLPTPFFWTLETLYRSLLHNDYYRLHIFQMLVYWQIHTIFHGNNKFT